MEETPKIISVEKSVDAPSVLGAEVVSGAELVAKPAFWQKLFASPRKAMNHILFAVFGIIILALFLYVLIKTKNRHLDLIVNGLIILVILGAIFTANYYFSRHSMIIAESLDYSNENK